ncbi:MAG TPA: hypothetical protein VLQ48_12965 [Chloroflexia bacterium]|nr:hypothetical protein [Chloroflexia bacterium]
MRINATIQVNGRPLRRAYVEHIVMGVGADMYMTDLQGQIRDNDFNKGIDSFTGNADIRIICQNPIVRVLDGNLANIGVYQDVSITDGATVNLNTNAEQRNHYNVLNRMEIAYEVVFQPLSFFSNLADSAFPLGRKSSLRATRDQAKRIDLSFPDNFPSPLAFVEPERLVDKFPLMHIKSNASDSRLFGTGGSLPTLAPGELAHAMHFSSLSEAKRSHAQDSYITFLASSVAAGLPGTHNFTVRTTSEVAYIEAADWFSQNFMEFMRARQGGTSTLVTPVAITPALHAEFAASEWLRLTTPRLLPQPVPALSGVLGAGLGGNTGGGAPLPGSLHLAPAVSRLLRQPMAGLTGGDMEGAVYAAIFADFGSQVGLDFAASTYFKANALTFGEYRAFVNSHHPEHSAALEAARSFWGL